MAKRTIDLTEAEEHELDARALKWHRPPQMQFEVEVRILFGSFSLTTGPKAPAKPRVRTASEAPVGVSPNGA